MMLAAVQGDAGKVLGLIAAGADTTIADDAGRTAADWARTRDDDKRSEVLEALGIRDSADLAPPAEPGGG